MIGKKYRVPRQYLDYILRKGDSFVSKFFIIRFKKNSTGLCRYRTIVSKKVDTKAVKRNLLRRRIYEALRLNSPTDEITQGLDLILIVKKNALKASYEAIEEDIKNNIIKHNYGEIK